MHRSRYYSFHINYFTGYISTNNVLRSQNFIAQGDIYGCIIHLLEQKRS